MASLEALVVLEILATLRALWLVLGSVLPRRIQTSLRLPTMLRLTPRLTLRTMLRLIARPVKVQQRTVGLPTVHLRRVVAAVVV